jgi:VWFA-related protein
MNRKLACLALILLLFCINNITATKAVWQTNPEETPNVQKFKVRTDVVEVRAVVTDQKNNIVENLKKDDFELLENNRRQEISFFSFSGVKTAELQSVREQLSGIPARSVLLYVDNLHLSFSSLNQVKQALHRFIDERMTGQDMISIIPSHGTLGVAQQFTQDKQLLRYGVEQISLGPIKRSSYFTPFLASDLIAEWPAAMEVAINILKWEDNIDGDFSMMCNIARNRAREILSEATFFQRTTLLTLRELTEKMRHLPGQRMIIIFSDGFSLMNGIGGPFVEELQSVIGRAVRSGVVIYAIDANGLQAPLIIDASIPAGNSRSLLQWYAEKSRNEELNGLYTMAVDTGGKMYQNSNDLGKALGQAFDENRSYYVLGYYLQSDSDMRKFRNIKVRVRNHPEYTIRAPKGFVPSDTIKAKGDEAEKTPQQRLLQTINAPLPRIDLGVSLLADFMEIDTDNKQVSLTACLDGNKLQYREQNPHHALALEIMYVIYDSTGNEVDARSANVEAALTPERLKQAQNNGFVFSQRLTLKPGVYQARIGVREVDTDRIGTATAWIDVPELARSKLAMSSLMLRDPSPASPAVAEGFNVNKMQRGKMVQGVRLYPRGDACGYFLRAYRGTQASADSDLAYKIEFYRGGALIKQEPWQPISAEAARADSKGWFDINGKVDLAEFNPGIYELRISIKDNRSKIPEQRSAIFGVE